MKCFMHGYIEGLFATFSSYGAFYYIFLIMWGLFATFFAVVVANFGIAPPPPRKFLRRPWFHSYFSYTYCCYCTAHISNKIKQF